MTDENFRTYNLKLHGNDVASHSSLQKLCPRTSLVRVPELAQFRLAIYEQALKWD